MKVMQLQKESYLLMGVLVMALLFRIIFITKVEFPFFDEIPIIQSSYYYMEKGFLGRLWYHPPLKNIIMYYSIAIFGDNPFGWRIPWVLSGTVSVYFMYLLTFNLMSSKRMALIAAFLLAIDPLHISQSRVNPDETMTVLTFIISMYLAFRYITDFKPFYLIIAGVMLGISLAVKWYAALMIGAVFLICIFTLFKRKPGWFQRFETGLFISVCLTVLPATVYLLAYFSWFRQGHYLIDFMQLQRDMYLFQQNREVSDFISMAKLSVSDASVWFISLIVAGFKEVFPGYIIVIPFICNPFVWLLTIPSITYTAYRCWVDRSFPLFIVAAAFFLQYTPLLSIKRPIFIHSAMSVLPIALIAISYTLVRIFDNPRTSWVLILYLCFNLTMVLISLPILISYPIPPDIYRNYLSWLDIYFR